jgi:hypothetical protein
MPPERPPGTIGQCVGLVTQVLARSELGSRTGSVRRRRSRSRRDAVGALRFRETSTIPGGGSGSGLLPEPRRCRGLSFAGSSRARRRRPGARARCRSRARQLARSLRRVPRADLIGGADLAAGSPRRAPPRRGGGSARPPPVTSPSPTPVLSPSAWPHVCLRKPRVFTGISRVTFPNFGHVRQPATAGASPPLKP